ncbi:nectin-1-like [Cetorhinus maximus]
MSPVHLLSFLQLALCTVAVTQNIKVDDFIMGNAGEGLKLPCHFSSNDANVTVVQVTWLRQAGPMSENLAVYNPFFGTSYPTPSGRVTFRNASSRNCTLTIDPLELADEGLYSCEVNVFPTGKHESHTNLTVLVKPVNSITAFPTDTGLSKALVATCTAANGKPAADITWVANVPGAVTSSQTKHPDRTVTITSQYRIAATRKANGEKLTCVVSHKALRDRVSLPVTISVRYPPEVSITGYDGNWHVNRHNVSLSCIAEANPPATTYHWTMTTGPVPESARGEGNHLFIAEVDRSVNGTWVCEATNAVGKGKGRIAVVVREVDSIAGKSLGPSLVYIVLGTVVGTLLIAVFLAVVIAKKRRKIEGTKSEAKHSPRKQNHIVVHATLNLNVVDSDNPARRENREAEATVNADMLSDLFPGYAGWHHTLNWSLCVYHCFCGLGLVRVRTETALG